MGQARAGGLPRYGRHHNAHRRAGKDVLHSPWNSDFKAFYEEARRIITSIPEDGDPYGTDKEIAAQGDFDVILLSATPKLYFTSISYTQYAPGHPLDYPLMNAGKAVTREGRLVMPIALTVSHAFVDGAHISLFFEKVEKYLKER